jgi:hypothetical protein
MWFGDTKNKHATTNMSAYEYPLDDVSMRSQAEHTDHRHLEDTTRIGLQKDVETGMLIPRNNPVNVMSNIGAVGMNNTTHRINDTMFDQGSHEQAVVVCT